MGQIGGDGGLAGSPSPRSPRLAQSGKPKNALGQLNAMLLKSLTPLALLGVLSLAAGTVRGAYTVERVTGSLNQPIAMAQAPGDGSSLYIVERSDSGNTLGRIRKYNLQSQTFSTFLDLTGSISSDGGLLSMTFHPEYQSNGLFYVTSNVTGTNRLDEYKVISGTPTLQRRLLQYQNLNNVYHTINQVHFRPNGNNNEIFVTAGDGGTQADDPGYNPALVESPTSPYGKLMKFDLTASFAAPATGPGQPGVSLVALGLRNPYRSSFDRATGDFYIGDVGFNTAEEVDFIPASHFATPAAPALNFGWTDREGTVQTVAPYAGGPGSPGDLNPIFDYAHGGQPLPHPSLLSGGSITGGYVYRGSVPELQGRYFFSDFTNGNVYSGAFNPATNPSAYNGTNLTGLTNHTVPFETAIGGSANIQFVSSFGEDNAGNLYIVKFGNSFFPTLGQGELFRISPLLADSIKFQIDRATGSITLTNNSAAVLSLNSLTLSSPFGAIAPAALTPITGHYDSAGNGSVDGNNAWHITSTAGSHTQFAETTNGDAGAIAIGQQVVFSPAGGWIPATREDVIATITNSLGTIINVTVSYTGNNGQAFRRGDLNFDGALSVADWAVFSANAYTSLAALSPAQAYGKGDLDGDGDNDLKDFRIFKQDFDVAHGVGAFAAMTGIVPEPSAARLLLPGLTVLVARRRKPCMTKPTNG